MEAARASNGHPSSLDNPVYRKLTRLVSKCKKIGAFKEMTLARKVRRHIRATIPNPQHTRIEYVRYADD